ncbi:hypothetical protein MKK88_21535 [Methylobacterium sp. E-005]|uniref:hypothetical protein n=1 Tax=Methylobacterium sp. E-005 TaxID=2836549 RepID=UPI001FB8764E|nr:hypothetical protein [Methylobacterium sp. E-005]MCJ2088540.1 hypothetical protein [Methylobacterium sp. E-005]
MIDVYRNRTRGLWSVRVLGRVSGHAQAVALADARFRVIEAGRLRALRTGRREVHAHVTGTLLDALPPVGAIPVGYRISEPGFRRRDTGEIIHAAKAVYFLEDGSCWAVL